MAATVVATLVAPWRIKGSSGGGGGPKTKSQSHNLVIIIIVIIMETMVDPRAFGTQRKIWGVMGCMSIVTRKEMGRYLCTNIHHKI